MVQQTVQFESVSLSEVGSGALTAFLFSGATLAATLASVTENGTLKGQYTGTVDDIAAGDYRLVVKFNGFTVSEPDETVSLLLAVGTYVSKRLAVLDTEGREAIADEIETRELTLVAAYDAAKTAATQTSVNDIPTIVEFEARTLAAAAYATAAQINSLQINTRANLSVPIEIEIPDASTQVYKIRIFLFDVVGNMEVPDSTPTIMLMNANGIDRSSRLSVATNVSAGVYSWDYTATNGDVEEQLNWTFTIIEGELTRVYPATSYVVEETAYRFTSTDRATLNSRASQISIDDIPTNTELASALSIKANTTDVAAVSAKIGTPVGASVSADIATININAGMESDLMISTTINTIVDSKTFTLVSGSTDNGTYNNQLIIITKFGSSTQKYRDIISHYDGLSMTVILKSEPNFNISVGDNVSIIAIGSSLMQSDVTSDSQISDHPLASNR